MRTPAANDAAWHSRFRSRLVGGTFRTWRGSPYKVLAYVRPAVRDAFVPRIRLISTLGRPVLGNRDEVAWMEAEYDPSQPLRSMLGRLESLGQESLPVIHKATSGSWSRVGLHPAGGVHMPECWAEHAVAHTADHLNPLKGGRAPA